MPILLEEHKKRLELYNKGLNDVEIGNFFGLTKSAIFMWRKKYNLKPHYDHERKKTNEEVIKIKNYNKEGYNDVEISEMLNRSTSFVFQIRNALGLKPNNSSKQIKRVLKRQNKLLEILKSNGPMPQNEVAKLMNMTQPTLIRYIKSMPNEIEKFRFKISGGSRGGCKYRSFEIYDGLSITHIGPVISIRNDERIIDFVAKYIPFEINTYHDATSIMQHLKKHLGKERTKKVIEKLGYLYGPGKNFSDEELIELYNKGYNDVKISKILQINTTTINERRRTLGLPAIGRMKKVS